MSTKTPTVNKRYPKYGWHNIKRDFQLNYALTLMILPVFAFYIIFHYGPMYGLQIAFRDYNPVDGVTGSPWVGLRHFISFFNNFYFGRLIRNTLLISVETLVFGFPAPIIFAILLNEIRTSWYKRTLQTLSYLPYFISTVVMCGIIVNFTRSDGVINDIVAAFGGQRKTMLQYPQYFRPVYVISGIWQSLGWNSIIYLAAISGIDMQLYEAAKIDGAGRFAQVFHVTIPSIAPTIIILFILRMGSMFSVGSDKVLLLYNSATYETADVISTYVYRRGILDGDFSFSAAVGLFNSLINFFLIIVTNKISSMVSETSLW
ncbi:MAG: sugar ABC transporter permease [Firmicutes bacterium]|nr:sugar ABC transporter permease [Bacillota bacterium]